MSVSGPVRDAGGDAPGGGSPAAAAAWTATGLVLIALTGLADYLTGYEVSVALFYLLPIALVSLRAGQGAGMIAATASGLTWYLADRALSQHYSSYWFLYWNTGIRFGIFLVVAVLLGKLRSALERQRRQRASLEELHRIKNEFLGMAAHDLRTPIAVVQIYSDLLLADRGAELSERQKELLEVIRTKSQFMLNLVSDLLDVARIEAGRLVLRTERQDYRAFLGEKLRLLGALAAQRGVTIRAAIDEGLPPLPFDRDRIEQVVDNLVFNGLKFSPRGGTLTVAVSRRGDAVETRISDEGPGIPAGQSESVFEAFHRAHASSPGGERGTGLGLAIARRIVEAHGGRIAAEGGAGGGASFVFTLPLGSGAPAAD